MRRIPIANKPGLYAIIDDADYDLVSKHSWSLGTKGYVIMTLYHPKRTVRMHNYILAVNGLDSLQTDHKDRDKLNNCRDNLRRVTQSVNMQNSDKVSKPTSSKYIGVCWHKRIGKWQAYISTNRLRRCLGYFKEEFDAAQAYNFAAYSFYGPEARFNNARI